MQRPGYERFALVSNPFHDLASESLQESEVFHVTQDMDEQFERMKQEVLERTRKAFVLISGPLGAGKTHRLRVTEAQAKAADAFALYMHLGEAPPDPLAAMAERIVEGAADRKLGRGLASPAWLRGCKALAAGKSMSPDKAGHALALGLGALAPAYLLLNDLDSLRAPEIRVRFLTAFLALVSQMPAGTMVVVACPDSHVARLQTEAPALFSRLNRSMVLRGLADDEAELVVAKRMAGKRLIDDLDPLYPFTGPAVAALNQASGGSPRRLLQLADLVLDGAVKDRAFQIGPELVQAILARTPATPSGAVRPVPVAPAPIAPVLPARPVPARLIPLAPAPAVAGGASVEPAIRDAGTTSEAVGTPGTDPGPPPVMPSPLPLHPAPSPAAVGPPRPPSDAPDPSKASAAAIARVVAASMRRS